MITARIHRTVSRAAQQRGKLVDGHEGSERIGDIGVDARLPVQQQAPEDALRVEVAEIQPPQPAVGGQEKVQAHQQPAGTGDPLDLAHHRRQVSKIAQPVADENAIERPVGEGKRFRVGADRASDAARPGELQHALGQVDGHGPGAGVPPRDQQGKVARAGCQVEHQRILGQRRPLHADLLPAPVHPIGKGARNEVVARRDRVEHGAHPAPILFFGWNLHQEPN